MGNRTGKFAAAIALPLTAMLAGVPRAPSADALTAGAGTATKAASGTARARMDSAVAAAAAGRSSRVQLRADGLRPHADVVSVEITAPAALVAVVRGLGGKVDSAAGGGVEGGRRARG